MTVGMVRGDRATSSEGGTSREVRFGVECGGATFGGANAGWGGKRSYNGCGENSASI